MRPITIGFVHFKTCSLLHFERAWTTVARQNVDFTERVLVYDNDSETDREALLATLDAMPVSPFLSVRFDTHGDLTKTHPYSVNRIVEQVETEWLLFTRSDYLLAPDAVPALWHEATTMEAFGLKPFVSGWCYQSAYDREQRDLPPFNIDGLPWRSDFTILTSGAVPGYCFHETDLDAGVWLTKAEYLREAGPMNEALSAWGYSQSTYQRVLTHKAGVTCRALPRYVSFHQQHGVWARDHTVARQQYNTFGEGR